MKLVDILARELTEWPKTVKFYYQSRVDSEIYANHADGANDPEDFYPTHEIIAEDRIDAEVSKKEWQAARAAYLASIQPARDPEIAAVVDKPANPWRRNRGRKTPPVPSGARVELKTRYGTVIKGTASAGLRWTLESSPGDIMQWRYAEPQQVQEDQHARVTSIGAPCSVEKVGDDGAVSVGYHMKLPEGYGAILEVEVKDDAKFNPIALRDEYKRITLECEELSQQMGKLTDRMGDIEAALRAEGFALIDTEGK